MAIFDRENRLAEKMLIRKAQILSRRSNRQFYLNAAIIGVYGWQMAIPVLLGILLGTLLDRHVPIAHISWTLNLIIIGFGIGIVNATRWVRREGLIKGKKTK